MYPPGTHVVSDVVPTRNWTCRVNKMVQIPFCEKLISCHYLSTRLHAHACNRASLQALTQNEIIISSLRINFRRAIFSSTGGPRMDGALHVLPVVLIWG